MSEAQHNSFHLIELLALHAIGCEKQGKTDEALVVLERALMLAAPGGVVFPFLETGAPMAELLRRLLTEGYGDTEFVKRILSAYHERGRITVGAGAPKAEGGTPAAQRLTDPLTSRELEVLELLRQGLYQREIAERLFVSPETIKTHVTHIYQKLGVRGRRQAVDKGRALDLLEHR
jgi:LuxR family maltose regulon positive regulatory protein